jgi:hypothetical protein
MKAANLLVRFLLELCALGALGYWGARTGHSVAGKIALSAGVVLVAATAWGLVVAPNAPFGTASLARWGVELTVFACAAGALVGAGWPRLAVVLVVVYALNRALMAVWDQ